MRQKLKKRETKGIVSELKAGCVCVCWSYVCLSRSCLKICVCVCLDVAVSVLLFHKVIMGTWVFICLGGAVGCYRPTFLSL